ncbi:L-aminoadipate-semialdehyde dehydrogenase-phosphopantetheinyl transferase [Monosporozyma servazzii]
MMVSFLVENNINNLKDENDVILILDIGNSGLEDAFKFETAMRLLPLPVQASVLSKKSQGDKIRTLCNRILQLYGCLVLSGVQKRNDLKFKRGKYGKPIMDSQTAHLAFSMSNGEEHVCMYIKKNVDNDSAKPIDVGIDIASVKDLQKSEELELYKDVFSEAEYTTLLRCPKEDINKLFAQYWSLKESYTKYLGSGLNIDLKQINTGIVNINQSETIRDIDNESIKFQSFWIPPHKEEIISICHKNDSLNNGHPPKVYKILFNTLLDHLEHYS